MASTPIRRIAALAFGVAAAAIAPGMAGGCGGDAFVFAPSDGSAESSTVIDASPGFDAVAAFCPALQAYDTRCSFTLPCDQTNLRNCNAEDLALSDAARKAFVDCTPQIQCTRGTDDLRTPCARGELASATPTHAQAKLAADYCAACQPDAGAGCGAATFFHEGLISSDDGPGFIALLYNDTSATAIDATCFPIPGDAGACDLRFRVCELLVLAPQIPPDACSAADSGL